MTILQAKGISKSYRIGDRSLPVFEGIDFSLEEGEKVAIIGPSGSGKSTLLNVLSGIDACDTGEVLFRGQNICGMKEKKLSALRLENFSFIFQAFHLIPTLTVLDNILVPVLARREKPDMEKIDTICERLGLTERLNHYPYQLSGGEMQRTAIARAVASAPAVIFSDEATGNLDEVNTIQVMELLKGCCEEEGIALLFVTHDMRLTRYADRIVTFTGDKRLTEESGAEEKG